MARLREAHTWISMCDLMKVTRLLIKYALRQYQVIEETAREDALATSLSHEDMMAFWKSIINMSDKAIPLSTSINGITGVEKISEMWSQHYSGILYCVSNVSRKRQCSIIIKFEVAMTIRDLKRGKTVGFDLLASEHYIHSDHMLKVPFYPFYIPPLLHTVSCLLLTL